MIADTTAFHYIKGILAVARVEYVYANSLQGFRTARFKVQVCLYPWRGEVTKHRLLTTSLVGLTTTALVAQKGRLRDRGQIRTACVISQKGNHATGIFHPHTTHASLSRVSMPVLSASVADHAVVLEGLGKGKLVVVISTGAWVAM